MIYFIRSADRSRIKIGTTTRMSVRLKQLAKEHGQELDVLAVTEGSFPEEGHLHEKFSHLRLTGEWFEAGDDLLDFIASEAKEWDGTDERSYKTIKVSRELFRLARLGAAFSDEDIGDYVSRIVVDRAKKDLDAFVEEYLAMRSASESIR